MTTHTEAAEVMAEEAADHLQAAANAPSPDEGLSAAADAVIDTTHWFTRFFETLTAGMTWPSFSAGGGLAPLRSGSKRGARVQMISV